MQSCTRAFVLQQNRQLTTYAIPFKMFALQRFRNVAAFCECTVQDKTPGFIICHCHIPVTQPNTVQPVTFCSSYTANRST